MPYAPETSYRGDQYIYGAGQRLKEVRICLTQQHIDRGQVTSAVIPGLEWIGESKSGSPGGCPVAIAINEQIPTCEAVVIGRTASVRSVLDPDVAYVLKLPESARLFVLAFDIFHQCGHVAPQLKPLTFVLRVPEELLPTESDRKSGMKMVRATEPPMVALMSK